MERGGDEVGPLSLNLWLSAHRYSGPQETFGAAWKWCWLFQWGGEERRQFPVGVH